ncbi:NDP-sugar dehydratase or epimerase [Actinomadura sp. NBRC 104412]|uniref:NAD-dependent epimerase/dehydratase family protein n=1 Tax=Actinomadura sp. NBRC 104412 TaxID=3032203 RepID=UPI0024A5D864|nr:NAD-dependent epimerase/dehydratase family protein [Actinomadura sp. NBRC 104412]GLZ05624.1 NDP-sugar dehydratase or epimerase [Actinomadura sp. NBRC 104412]
MDTTSPETAARNDTVAVTGGSGFVGGHLVSALAGQGRRVVVVDLDEPSPELAALPGVSYRRADLRDYGETLLALRGVDTVFHLAGNASGTRSVQYPRFDFQINGLGTCHVGNACVEMGVRRLVYMSSAIVYGTPQRFPIDEEHPTRPFLPYGASKFSGELTLRSLHEAVDLSVVMGRCFVIYGPGEDPRTAGGEVSQFMRWQLNDLPIPVVGDIDRKTRDFVHVSDVCAALIAMAENGTPGEAYNIGSGTETSMRQLADAVATATGRPARLKADTSQMEDSFRLVADISKLRGIGYRPAVTLAQGLESLAGALGPFPELPTATVAFRREAVEQT